MSIRRVRRHPVASAFLIGGLAAVCLTGTAPASAAGPLEVTTLSDSGPGSLREAVIAANGQSGATITFAVNGVITLDSDLAALSSPMTIDGTSAPTYADGGPPVVQVDFDGHHGLDLAPGSDGSTLLALSVTDASGAGITLSSSQNTLDGNYVGLDLSGAEAGNQGNGILATATSSANVIGENAAEVSGAVSNVVSGNGGSGIRLSGSTDNTIVANRIGTDPTGTSKVPNAQAGIAVTNGSDDNQIGGTVFTDSATGDTNNPTGSKGTVDPVFVVPPLGNLVSGNAGDGILVDDSRGTVLNGNFVGTTADGDSALGNAGDGVSVQQSDQTVLQGCAATNEPFVYYNVLSANGGQGLRISSSDGVRVQANFFGVGADNTTLLGNGGNGILVEGTSKNTQVGGVIPLGNVSAGNQGNGIEVKDEVRGFITFNTFGGLLAFKGAAPNARNGLLITSTGGDNLVRTNVFSGNTGNGIVIGGGARGVTVDPNIVGATTNGRTKLANGRNGLLITDRAHDNVIGGTLRSVIPQNTFSGNDGWGVVINDRAHDNVLAHSYVGTQIFGNRPLANGSGGVLVGGHARNNVIGGAHGKLPVNVISGNRGPGVRLTSATSRNTVTRNNIGLGSRGAVLPNAGRAIVDQGRHTTIRNNRTSG